MGVENLMHIKYPFLHVKTVAGFERLHQYIHTMVGSGVAAGMGGGWRARVEILAPRCTLLNAPLRRRDGTPARGRRGGHHFQQQPRGAKVCSTRLGITAMDRNASCKMNSKQ